MSTAPRMLFTNLAVTDLAASMAFFEALGLSFNPKFTSEAGACMVISDSAFVMLLTQDHFAGFTGKPTADPAAVTEAILCVSAESREAVDVFADAALGAGGSPAKDPMDHGFMYGRSFYDLDGHHWEVMWMDPAAAEQGPADMAQSA